MVDFKRKPARQQAVRLNWLRAKVRFLLFVFGLEWKHGTAIK